MITGVHQARRYGRWVIKSSLKVGALTLYPKPTYDMKTATLRFLKPFVTGMGFSLGSRGQEAFACSSSAQAASSSTPHAIMPCSYNRQINNNVDRQIMHLQASCGSHARSPSKLHPLFDMHPSQFSFTHQDFASKQFII